MVKVLVLGFSVFGFQFVFLVGWCLLRFSVAVVKQVSRVRMKGFHCGARLGVSGLDMVRIAGLLSQPRTGGIYRFVVSFRFSLSFALNPRGFGFFARCAVWNL